MNCKWWVHQRRARGPKARFTNFVARCESDIEKYDLGGCYYPQDRIAFVHSLAQTSKRRAPVLFCGFDPLALESRPIVLALA